MEYFTVLRFSGVISYIELMLVAWKPPSRIISAFSQFLILLAHVPFPQNPFITLAVLQVSHTLLFHSISQSLFTFLLAEQFQFFRLLKIIGLLSARTNLNSCQKLYRICVFGFLWLSIDKISVTWEDL